MTPAQRRAMRATRATIAEGNNRNCNDDKDACASTATKSAYQRRAITQPVMRRWCIARQWHLEDKRWRRRDKWALQVATTRWRRRGRGKVTRRSWWRRDNTGDMITSWQTRGKWEGRRTRGKQEEMCQWTRGGGVPRGREAAAAQLEASRQPAGGASGASSSSSASFPPRRDGGAPCKIPSDGGGSDVSCVVHEFGIGKIRASTVVIVDPLASSPLLPPSDVWRTLLAAAAPAAKQLQLQHRCGGWCIEKITQNSKIIRYHKSRVIAQITHDRWRQTRLLTWMRPTHILTLCTHTQHCALL